MSTRERIAAEVELWGGPLDGHRQYVHDVDAPLEFETWAGAGTSEVIDGTKPPTAYVRTYKIVYRLRSSEADSAPDIAAFGGTLRFDYMPPTLAGATG